MKIIRVFIASSIVEFERERIFIGDYIRKLNDSISVLGQRVKLSLCEDEYINSQPYYDRLIEDSDIFIALIGSSLGDYSRHELEEVANNAINIKKKIIFLTNHNGKALLPKDLNGFETFVIEGDYKNQIINKISDFIEEVAQSAIDESLNLPVDSYYIYLPKQQNIEIAVLSNVIRRLRDQDNDIRVSERLDQEVANAYVALIKNMSEIDESLITKFLRKEIIDERLWLFADNAFAKPTADNQSRDITQLLNDIVNKTSIYPDYYNNFRTLGIQFENKLLRAIMKFNAKFTNGFIYIVEDHWLFRKSLTSTTKYPFINLINIKGDKDRIERKERVIVNLLNQYWLNGNLDKHIDSITKLMLGEFEGFRYTIEDLDEVKDYKQAFYDYACDTLEIIQNVALNHDADWLCQRLGCIENEIFDNQRILKNFDLQKLYLIIGNVYSLFTSLASYALCSYKESLKFAVKDNADILELTKYSLSSLCCNLFDSACWDEIFELAQIGINITTEEDFFHSAAFRIFQYCVKNDKQSQDLLASEIVNYVDNPFMEKSNEGLYLKLLFLLTSVQTYSRYMPISAFTLQIEYVIERYQRYLTFDTKYWILYARSLSKKAVINNDLDGITELIMQYNENIAYQGTQYYDILYDKATIYLNKGMIIDAADLFRKLINVYPQDCNRGSCLQSLALCHMALYKEETHLKSAEDAYNKALELYSNIKDFYMVGNVMDGLSYCYILQKRYSEAEIWALKSIEISDYNVPNKFCNYISSLLCLGRYTDALAFYSKINEKEQVKFQLLKDWNGEMTDCGIDISSFYNIFSW